MLHKSHGCLSTNESQVLFTGFPIWDSNGLEYLGYVNVSMAVAQLQLFVMHLQFYTSVILPSTLQHTKPAPKPGSCFTVLLQSSLMVLYSKSICNRSLYSTLLCKVIGGFQESGMLRSTLYVVKCPEVMDVNGHVCFFVLFFSWQLQNLGLASYPVKPVFRTNCISYML